MSGVNVSPFVDPEEANIESVYCTSACAYLPLVRGYTVLQYIHLRSLTPSLVSSLITCDNWGLNLHVNRQTVYCTIVTNVQYWLL